MNKELSERFLLLKLTLLSLTSAGRGREIVYFNVKNMCWRVKVGKEANLLQTKNFVNSQHIGNYVFFFSAYRVFKKVGELLSH